MSKNFYTIENETCVASLQVVKTSIEDVNGIRESEKEIAIVIGDEADEENTPVVMQLTKEEATKLASQLLSFSAEPRKPFEPHVDAVFSQKMKDLQNIGFSLYLGTDFKYIKDSQSYITTKENFIKLMTEVGRALQEWDDLTEGYTKEDTNNTDKK